MLTHPHLLPDYKLLVGRQYCFTCVPLGASFSSPQGMAQGETWCWLWNLLEREMNVPGLVVRGLNMKWQGSGRIFPALPQLYSLMSPPPPPWTEEPGGIWSIGLQRVGHD